MAAEAPAEHEVARILASGAQATIAEYVPAAQQAFRLAYALTGGSDAHELYSRTIGHVARLFTSGETTRDLKPWLFAQVSAEAATSGSLAVGALAGAVHAPAAERSRSGAEASLLSRFEELSHTERGGLVMREVSGLGYGAIADVLGISSGSARRIVGEARLAMAETVPGPTAECKVVRGALAMDELTPLARSGVDRHLERCPYCSRVDAGIAGLPAALRKALPQISKAAVIALLKEELAHAAVGEQSDDPPKDEDAEAEAKRAYRRRRSLAALAVLALLFVVAALAVSTGRLGPEPAPTGPPFALAAPALWDFPAGPEPEPGPGPGPGPGPKPPRVCPRGQVGTPPNCKPPICDPSCPPCPRGQVGTQPKCRPICDPNCPPPPCRSPRVEPGCVCPPDTIEPDCHRRPKCPSPRLGPECACPQGTVEPDCHRPPKCLSPRIGPECACPQGTVEPDCSPKPKQCPEGWVLRDGECVHELHPLPELCDPPHHHHHHHHHGYHSWTPEPQPEPAPQPAPQPDPEPQPNPEPQPDPEPHPGHHHTHHAEERSAPPQADPPTVPEPQQPTQPQQPTDEQQPADPPQPPEDEGDDSDEQRGPWDRGNAAIHHEWAVDPQRRRRERKRWALH